MERRNFLSLVGLGALALTVAPAAVRAEDFRKLKPTVWTAKTVEDAVKAMYGSDTATESGITITTPDVAASGGAVPVNVKSDLDLKSLTVFQNANPESTVIAFTIGKSSVVDYDMKMKLKSVGDPITITVIAEGNDGKLYKGTRTLNVALGGCEG